MPIYLDHNASTPLDPAVAEEMRGLLGTAFGNPSSDHWAGRPAREVVDRARARTAALLGCDPAEIVFTSGGSEANNHALKGTFFAARRRGVRAPHFVTTAVEHPAILEPLRFLERLGAGVTAGPGRSAMAGSIRRPWPAPCAPRRSWSASCTPTTRSARSSRWPRSPPSRTSPRHSRPYRCGAVGGEDPGPGGRPRCRSPECGGAQALRSQRRRRALHPPGAARSSR